MSAQPVDVLAVMDNMLDVLKSRGSTRASTQAVTEARAAVAVAIEAARNTVTYYTAVQPGRTCLFDELNPCGGIEHWGGSYGCPHGCPLCSARAALAACGVKP